MFHSPCIDHKQAMRSGHGHYNRFEKFLGQAREGGTLNTSLMQTYVGAAYSQQSAVSMQQSACSLLSRSRGFYEALGP